MWNITGEGGVACSGHGTLAFEGEKGFHRCGPSHRGQSGLSRGRRKSLEEPPVGRVFPEILGAALRSSCRCSSECRVWPQEGLRSGQDHSGLGVV